MKYAMLAAMLALSGCAPASSQAPQPEPPTDKAAAERLAYGVSKFEDGAVTCYLYFQDAISCVRMDGGAQ
jgi:hypothetical protein